MKHLTRGLTLLAACLLAIAAGWACLRLAFGEPLARRSYDLPFVWRTPLDTHEVVIVYLDDVSAKKLQQQVGNVWNRALHVPLLERLTQDGARLVYYDIVFDAPSADPAIDAALVDAIQRNGKVVLGGALEKVERTGGLKEQRIVPPDKTLRKAAAGWGLVVFDPVDADYAVRQIFFGTTLVPSATWKAAQLLGAPITRESREKLSTHWINYYGPRNSFISADLSQALDPQGVPPGFFKDKIVLVGGRPIVGTLSVGRDEFGTPYSSANHQFSPGVEIHATILLNLLRGEWLMRLRPNYELALIIVAGLIAGALTLLRPWLAVVAALICSSAVMAIACWSAWHQRVWFDWLVPSTVQIPLGLVSSISAQYLLESRRRKELRRAFGFYLSPQMADRIADSDFDLKPGGKLVDVTVIFTDLENFTAMSEHLAPDEVSKILTDYFGQTTRCILANKGTIIKYIGDAVFAAWGAPIDEPRHAIRAAEAACDLRCLTELQIRGKRLRTRIGIHSGRVLAGNLGSEFRFDYTMIGDAVNFASRLESLNKYLSTQILISDAVRVQLGDQFVTRRLGEFKVAGKTNSVVIHELICRCEAQNGERKWIDVFEDGLGVFRAGEFARARELMDQTRELRGGADGPSEFYIRKIEKLQGNGAIAEWNGVVELTEK
jgi:adenylate cyclase